MNTNAEFSLKNDYSELAHPAVLEALSKAQGVQFEGYGLDVYSQKAAQLIKNLIKAPHAQVHFVCGGTGANQLVIASALRPHEAVIAADSGHINVHEAGAIEATGHKICIVASEDGKLRPGDIETVVSGHTDEHMVLPRLVYISQSTETGLVYTKSELTAVSEACRRYNLYLFIDGARLGAALNCDACDLTYADIAELADVFYIGGTKNGALFGEAVVITNEALMKDFRYHIKQRGSLIAKGAVLGIQFEALFYDGLYDRLASDAAAKAMRLACGIKKAGYTFKYPAQTNMIFPVLPDCAVSGLRDKFAFHDWHKAGNMTTIRLVTSWATTNEVIDEFITHLSRH